MVLTELKDNISVVGLTCSTCQVNVIYVKVNDLQTNDAPYKPDQFTCTECNQGLMPNNSNQE